MTAREPRLSGPTLKVLHLYVVDPHRLLSGVEITKASAIVAGTLYPLLARLQAAGWLESEWEEADPKEVGRPLRRFHRMTELGRSRALAALSELQIPGAVAA
ncbi:helix-turn-helix transcriptional regulator [Methylobacterium sp. 092160098-2]|uniref:PadR family transcriptional regulator n=1 Tax=Methylobacterium sp. 092160098-2 TaxID=3025129 RepID=UPI002381CDEE|nr:helix-turn-helix transcriptional regulator [Methylobacterium sp. 092160098-2]MDE4914535.1 helix-turn-helix transcriptional regulator [Methylobacterium sp. 092160098-2]